MAENYIPISSWAEDDKPREKMLSKGVATLSTNELLAILIRSGCGGESALDLSRRILLDLSNDLNTLARLSVLDFTNRYKGEGCFDRCCNGIRAPPGVVCGKGRAIRGN